MRGNIIRFFPETESGQIRGENKIDYIFELTTWSSESKPFPGEAVEFTVEEGDVTSVTHWDNSMAGPITKSRKKAALFAFFLGWTGAHKFYTGRTKIGIIHALPAIGIISALMGIAFSGMVLLFFVAGCLLNAVSLIEAMIYLSKTDEAFQRIYVDGKRRWF